WTKQNESNAIFQLIFSFVPLLCDLAAVPSSHEINNSPRLFRMAKLPVVSFFKISLEFCEFVDIADRFLAAPAALSIHGLTLIQIMLCVKLLKDFPRSFRQGRDAFAQFSFFRRRYRAREYSNV